MLEHFSDDEIERMTAFTERPSYEREPEQLLPDGADERERDDSGKTDSEDTRGRGPQTDDS